MSSWPGLSPVLLLYSGGEREDRDLPNVCIYSQQEVHVLISKVLHEKGNEIQILCLLLSLSPLTVLSQQTFASPSVPQWLKLFPGETELLSSLNSWQVCKVLGWGVRSVLALLWEGTSLWHDVDDSCQAWPGSIIVFVAGQEKQQKLCKFCPVRPLDLANILLYIHFLKEW